MGQGKDGKKEKSSKARCCSRQQDWVTRMKRTAAPQFLRAHGSICDELTQFSKLNKETKFTATAVFLPLLPKAISCSQAVAAACSRRTCFLWALRCHFSVAPCHLYHCFNHTIIKMLWLNTSLLTLTKYTTLKYPFSWTIGCLKKSSQVSSLNPLSQKKCRRTKKKTSH